MKAASTKKEPLLYEKNTKYGSKINFLSLEIFVLLLAGFLGMIFQNGFPLLFAALVIIVLLMINYLVNKRSTERPQSFLYEALFNQTNDAVFILDLQGNHLKANQRAVDLFGYTLEELEGRSYRGMVDPSQVSDSELNLKRLLAGEKLDIYERVFISKTGEKIPVEVNVQIVSDAQDKPLHIQSIVRDIRHRKQNQSAQKYTQDLLQTLIGAIPDRAVVLDKKGIYRSILNSSNINPEMSSDSLIGKHVSDVSTPEFGAFCVSMIEKTLEADSLQVFEYEVYFDNSLKTFDGRTIPFYDNHVGEKLVFWVSRDITESKAAARVLEESERRLRALANGLPDRAIILDAHGNYRDVLSEQFESNTPMLNQVQGKHLRDILEPKYVEFCLMKIRETLESNQSLAFDYEIDVAGKHYYLDGRTVPTSDPKTGEELVIWISRDIGRLKQAEQSVKYQNRLYSLLTELAIEFVNLPLEQLDASIQKMLQQVSEFIEADRSYINTISTDMSQTTIAYEWYAPPIHARLDSKNIRYISKDSWSMKQFLQNQIVSIPSVSQLPPEAVDERKNLQRLDVKSVVSIPLFKNGKLIGTLGFNAIQSEKIWSESTSDLLKIVGEIYLNALQRKEAEEALSDSEKRMRILLSSLPDRAVVFDRQGHYYEILKREFDTSNMPDELHTIEQGQSISDHYSAEFVAFCLNKIQDTLDTNQTQVFQYASPLRGKHYQMEARIIPFRDPLTKQERVFWVSRDISERIEAEQQRLELSLEREKVDFLRQFVDSITHDLKTPITVIGTSLHLIENSDNVQKRQSRMTTIRKQLGTLSHMVDELLAVARLDEIPQLQFTPTDFYEVLHDVVDFLAPKAELKQINLELNLADAQSIVLASYDELSRAISNLIDNAIKYTPNEGSVSISVYHEASELVFEVRDTGIGISSEDIKRVFERFFRADRARKEAPGTGLGLEITHRIIELHGGKINLESELNHGTTFRVWLPLYIDEASRVKYEQ